MSEVKLVKNFCRPVRCLLALLIVAFSEQNLLVSMESHLWILRVSACAVLNVLQAGEVAELLRALSLTLVT